MFQVKWLWECLEGKRKLYCFAVFLSVAASVILIVNPTLARMFVDKVVVGTENPDGTVFHDTSLLVPLLAGMICVAIIRSAMRYGMVLLYENTSQGLLFKIRTRVYSNLCAQDMAFYDRMKTGDLMTRLTGDLDLVRHTVAWIVYNIVESSLIFTIAVIYFFSVNTVMTLSILAITPFLFVTTFFFSKTVRPFYASLREKLALMNSRAQENIAANRIVRAFAREDYETAIFDERNEDYRAANIKAQRQWLKFFPAIESMAQLMNVVVLFVGGLLIIKDKLTPGELASFTAMTWCVSMPMRSLGMLLNDIQRFFVSADKVIELYYSNPVIKNPENAYAASTINGDIDFDNVSFSYQNNINALSNINLHIKKGSTVAVMGPTGSGKTTLVNLIMRLADASAGTVKVDGVDVKNWDLLSLRSHIGTATQEVFLFSDTVDSNIAFGNADLPEEEVRRYVDISAADFIIRLSDGYNTIIGERGTGLSGGQKQRIALARALAVKPSVLILDDTTSAVDLETEKYIQEQLKKLDFECTKIIIAQRISSVKQADMIVIMEDGKIADSGTHEELLSRNGGYYKDIYNLQYAENQNERGNV